MKPDDTAALVWLRALQRQMRGVQKNLEYCIRGQLSGKLAQEDLEEFVRRVNRFGRSIVANTTPPKK